MKAVALSEMEPKPSGWPSRARSALGEGHSAVRASCAKCGAPVARSPGMKGQGELGFRNGADCRRTRCFIPILKQLYRLTV
jgi:hypothetical protein